MADNSKPKNNPNPGPGPSPKKGPQPGPSNVIQLASARCKAHGCNKKSSRAEFCEEHFEWFKAGLITKEGALAADFEKKYQHFTAGKRKAA